MLKKDKVQFSLCFPFILLLFLTFLYNFGQDRGKRLKQMQKSGYEPLGYSNESYCENSCLS